MKVLVACEFSGVVRQAFAAKGHDAWSCDLLPSEKPGNHIQGDVLDILDQGWDLMIAHPPCTYLAVSGARWWKDRVQEQNKALDFVRALMDAPCGKIAIENPVSKISTAFRKPDQIIQPWQFGHGETKATCLWLKGLPKLTPTKHMQTQERKMFFGLLQILFIALKLTGVISWSWWLVLIPAILYMTVWVSVLVLAFFGVISVRPSFDDWKRRN